MAALGSVLDAFKLKPYDLEPIFAEWKDGPVFKGDPKKDLPVDEWLEKIRAGCEERKIPEEYWYKVAQHFMGKKAKARFDELKAVVSKVHGGKYRWTWKKFKIAVRNMGWGIDASQTETIKVRKESSGIWSMWRRKDDEKKDTKTTERSPPSRSNSLWSLGKSRGRDEALVHEESSHSRVPSRRTSTDTAHTSERPTPTRSNTDSFWPRRRNSKDIVEDSSATNTRPVLAKAKSHGALVTTENATNHESSHSNSDSTAVATVTQAPVWLLNACTALEYITSEHPKAMSVLSAILITVGSIPSMPAISAGAGGAILASGAAHAMGAIAVGLGQALSTTIKNQQEANATITGRLTEVPQEMHH